jgi:hypothetical protein
MVGANRNRKIPLKKAWQHYWAELFQCRTDWQSDLEFELRQRLYFPGEVSGIPSQPMGQTNPTWAQQLQIAFNGNNVSITAGPIQIDPIPLFSNSNVLVLSNWESKNPLDKIEDGSALSPYEQEQSRDLITAVVRTCGHLIQNKLLSILKQSDQPSFAIYHRSEADDFATEKPLSNSSMSTISALDIAQNTFLDRMRLPKYHHIAIKKMQSEPGKAGPKGSFDEADDTLIEDMKSLIDQGQTRSVREAACKLIKDAERRLKSSDDSVQRRLQNKFSAKYPNYLNRKVPKSS